MFVIGVSYQALLGAVAGRCSLEYAGFVQEVTEDGTVLCGVELVLPPVGGCSAGPTVYFWSPVQSTFCAAYEQASLQAISYLQSVYAFLIVDYSFQGLVWYRGLARAAVNADTGIGACEAMNDHEASSTFSVLCCSHGFLCFPLI
ncbi:hypothetical protein BS78_08G035300 [Paspalum vaginatum]|nr:hypothetical protein BS78_08G035300 [Paspalum vaginatum]